MLLGRPCRRLRRGHRRHARAGPQALSPRAAGRRRSSAWPWSSTAAARSRSPPSAATCPTATAAGPTAVRLATPREDALRRDFTINGMFYDPVTREVIDYVGGRDDLRRRHRPHHRHAPTNASPRTTSAWCGRCGSRCGWASPDRAGPPRPSLLRAAHPRPSAASGSSTSCPRCSRRPAAREALEILVELDAGRAHPRRLWPATRPCGRRPSGASGRGGRPKGLAPQHGGPALRSARQDDLAASSGGGGRPTSSATRSPGWAIVATTGGRGEMDLAAFRKLAGHEVFPRLRGLWKARRRASAEGDARAAHCPPAPCRRLREIRRAAAGAALDGDRT